MRYLKDSESYPQSHTDSELIELALSGEQMAFETLMERYKTTLLHFTCSLVGDSNQAHDILQDVFLKMYKFLPYFRRDTDIRAWLFKVARNRCIDYLRRNRFIVFSILEEQIGVEGLSVLEMIPDPVSPAEEQVEYHELRDRLLQALLRLPPKLRSVIVLHYVNGLTFTEVGHMLGMPTNTARIYCYRAKLRLRAFLAHYMVSASAS